MVAKRVMSTYSSTQPPAKRLKSLEKRVSRITRNVDLKPDRIIAVHTAAVANAAIGVIDLTSFTTEAKFLSVNIRGSLGGANVDVYLVQTVDETAPVYADFQATIGGFLATSGNQDEAMYIWGRSVSSANNFNVTLYKRYPKGILTRAAQGRHLWVVVKNNSGSSVTPSLSVESYVVPHIVTTAGT